MTLQDIKAGDIVVLHRIGIGPSRTLLQVERVTKTQIIFSRDRRFRKSNGYAVGAQSVFARDRIAVPREGEVEGVRVNELEEVRAELRYHRLVHMVSKGCEITKLRRMPLETLIRLANALEESDAD